MIHGTDLTERAWTKNEQLQSWPVHTRDQPLDGATGSCTRAILVVSDALILTGWLDTPAFRTLTQRCEDQQLTLFAIRQKAAPCELLPSWIPLFSERYAEQVVGAVCNGETLDAQRPVLAKIAVDAPAWCLLASRVHTGESADAVHKELGLPSGLQAGAFFAPDLRLLQQAATDSASSQWDAEDSEAHIVRLAVVHDHQSGRFSTIESVVRAWAELNHPRVQPVHSTGLRNGAAWVAWRAPSLRLDQAIAEGMGSEHALLALLDIADALEAGHASGCIHGCPAPTWIGIESDGARLSGFGLSTLTRGAADSLLFTAPELLDPSANGTRAGDLYGFGMLVLLALHGDTLPYWVLRDTSRLLRQLDPEPPLAAALRSALEWNPADRLTSPRALVDALLANDERVERLARVALTDGLLDQAERLLDRLDASPSARPQQALRLSLARKRASRGAPDDAIRSLVILAERSEDAAAIWLEIAELYRSRGRPDDALAAARKAWDFHRDRSSAENTLRLLVTVDRGNIEGWAELLINFVDDQEKADLVQKVALHLRDAGAPERALSWLENVEESHLISLRRDLRVSLGDPTARLEQWLETSDPGALELALELATTLGHPLLSDVATAVLDHDPDHLLARRSIARLALDANDLPAALEAYAVLCATPGALTIDHLAHARCLSSAGRPASVLEATEAVLGLEPDHVPALELAIDAAELLDRPALAARHLNRWLQLNETGTAADIPTRLRLAELLRAAERPTLAARHYRDVLVLDPTNARAAWALRVLHPHTDALDLPFGPHEALASLLTPMLAASNEASPWEIALHEVDRLSRRNAITDDLFASLFTHFPNWVEPISAVLASWNGTHPAVTPAEAARWRGCVEQVRGMRPVLPAGDRLGLHKESGALEVELVDALDDPEPTTPACTSSNVPLLVVGVGPQAQRIPLPSSCVLTPTVVPSLPGMLQVFRSVDQTYLAVDEGTLKHDGDYRPELRIQPGDRITWRGLQMRLEYGSTAPQHDGNEPIPDELPLLQDLDEPTEPRSVLRFIEPVFIRNLPAEEPALVWEADGLLRALPLPEGRLFAGERPGGALGFTQHPHPKPWFELFREGTSTFMIRSSGRRALIPNEALQAGSTRITFHARGRHASPADSPTIKMMMPTPVPAPWLVLDDGTSGGHPLQIDRHPFRLGRARECEMQIRTDAMLSRVHCQIEQIDGHWYALDSGSANGTRVNGLPITGRVLLEEGDRVELGQTLVLFTRHGPLPSLEGDTEEEELLELEELEPDPDEEEDTRSFSISELKQAREKSISSILTPEEGARMVAIANTAFSVLFRALDDVRGAGSGRSELQRMVDSARPPSLVSGLNIRNAELPVEAIVTRLEARAATERRRTLERELLEMVDHATESVSGKLSKGRAAEVAALLSALEYRRRLQL